ncbi:hypothetical protein [Mesorhizobium sp. B4-1-3]|uniref:hypothetical protein n=1 Tax=Mesorhizobium sp. B4-1-3 TaxID=2589889 RepID=UPI0015E36DC2|nr:hypothetical protein [Mesorhizobium sp. B4-1-3]
MKSPGTPGLLFFRQENGKPAGKIVTAKGNNLAAAPVNVQSRTLSFTTEPIE